MYLLNLTSNYLGTFLIKKGTCFGLKGGLRWNSSITDAVFGSVKHRSVSFMKIDPNGADEIIWYLSKNCSKWNNRLDGVLVEALLLSADFDFQSPTVTDCINYVLYLCFELVAW